MVEFRILEGQVLIEILLDFGRRCVPLDPHPDSETLVAQSSIHGLDEACGTPTADLDPPVLHAEPTRELLELLGVPLSRQGRHDEAFANLRTTLEHGLGQATVHCTLGLARAELGRHREAAEVRQQTLKLNRRLEHALFLGRSLQMLGRYDSAARCFRRLVERRPDHAAAHNPLGSVVQLLGDCTRAPACYHRAFGHPRRDPGDGGRGER